MLVSCGLGLGLGIDEHPNWSVEVKVMGIGGRGGICMDIFRGGICIPVGMISEEDEEEDDCGSLDRSIALDEPKRWPE